FDDVRGAFNTYNWGAAQTDTLVPADYDGDGSVDIAVWRDVDGQRGFFVLYTKDFTSTFVPLGVSTDDPTVVADYDGDGKDDPAVYHCPVSTPGSCTFSYVGSLNNPQQ